MVQSNNPFHCLVSQRDVRRGLLLMRHGRAWRKYLVGTLVYSLIDLRREVSVGRHILREDENICAPLACLSILFADRGVVGPQK